MQIIHSSSQILMEIELIDIFSKHSNVKFRENPSSGSRVVTSGRVNRQTDR